MSHIPLINPPFPGIVSARRAARHDQVVVVVVTSARVSKAGPLSLRALRLREGANPWAPHRALPGGHDVWVASVQWLPTRLAERAWRAGTPGGAVKALALMCCVGKQATLWSRRQPAVTPRR